MSVLSESKFHRVFKTQHLIKIEAPCKLRSDEGQKTFVLKMLKVQDAAESAQSLAGDLGRYRFIGYLLFSIFVLQQRRLVLAEVSNMTMKYSVTRKAILVYRLGM